MELRLHSIFQMGAQIYLPNSGIARVGPENPLAQPCRLLFTLTTVRLGTPLSTFESVKNVGLPLASNHCLKNCAHLQMCT